VLCTTYWRVRDLRKVEQYMPAVVEDIRGNYGDVEESAMGDCEIMSALRSRVVAYKSAGMDALSAMSRAILLKVDRVLWEEYCESAARSKLE
jgi:hypothetical protein